MFERPTLPQHDPAPEDRSKRLAEARDTYRYAYDWPPGVAVAAEVPHHDTYSPRYVAHLLPVSWTLFENSLELAELVVDRSALRAVFEEERKHAAELAGAAAGGWFLRLANVLSAHVTSEKGVSVEAYGRLFAKLEAPPCASCWDDDRTFAWQRIAGVNPMALARVTTLPDHVAISEAEYARAIGDGDTLAAAIAEGRLYACDYALLDGLPTGSTDGRAKWLPAPIALFAVSGGSLRPVAIQAGQRDAPVFVPGDGEHWRLAKLAVQVADANHHEAVAHLGRTHLVMEAVTLAMRRQLSERHPLAILLGPHCEFTLAINHSAATDLIAPGGVVDRLFGGTIQATTGVVKTAIDTFDLGRAAVPLDVEARGLDGIPVHPYRDDALLVFGAIRRFADAYVRSAYAADADVAGDAELAAFLRELAADDGGRLHGVPAIPSIEALVAFVATVLWLASGQHAAVNFPQYPFMGVVPNMAGAFWSPWDPRAAADEATYTGVLPPYDLALGQTYTVYQLSSIRVNHLGEYPVLHFRDGRARAAADRFREELADIDDAIAARDAGRFLPYPFLRPSQIPASIHI